MPPPLITTLYTADPSAHAFEGKVYIYPSHDRETDIAFNDNGDQYDMNDYHVFSTDSLEPSPSSSNNDDENKNNASKNYKVTDHGPVLRASDVPWVSKQMWAPDCARSPTDGRYYLYFPARDRDSIFRIGVAVSESGPAGPFVPDPEPIPGSFSIDPASFVDPDTGVAYLYFGGLWGGQLQCYQGGGSASEPDGKITAPPFDAAWLGPKEPSGTNKLALFPKVATLAPSMRTFASPAQDLVILCPNTNHPIPADDHARRFFEASWMHKRKGTYYFSYSTGDTHYLVYATSNSPLGPFTYAGRILEPVLGWTTHHSIVEFPEGSDRWWLFYHDCEISKGVDHLRNVKVREIFHGGEGRILPVDSSGD
ncbi:glycoside hydrolase family 43 protein [Xylariaceae sp. FL0255]|nr:glycoside hydrolase family 43 protein [Xylariaceae sp. FL0255]